MWLRLLRTPLISCFLGLAEDMETAEIRIARFGKAEVSSASPGLQSEPAGRGSAAAGAKPEESLLGTAGWGPGLLLGRAGQHSCAPNAGPCPKPLNPLQQLQSWEQGCKYRLECEAGWSLRLLSGDLFLYLFCIFLLASRLPTPPVPERGLSSV